MLDKRIEQVIVSLTSSQDLILIAAADGTLAADVRPLVRLNVSVIIEDDGRREQGYAGGGARADLNYFLNNDFAMDLAREAVRQAVVLLDAAPAPAGAMPVVLGNGWPGILLHEAVGHGLEGDFNRKGTSAFTGRVGQQVASPLCTIVDDGTIQNRRGSLAVDDEGTPGQYNVLIEKGILKGYMQDKLNCAIDGRGADRQWSKRIIRAHSNAADDQHLTCWPVRTIHRKLSSPLTKDSMRLVSVAARSTSLPASLCFQPTRLT